MPVVGSAWRGSAPTGAGRRAIARECRRRAGSRAPVCGRCQQRCRGCPGPEKQGKDPRVHAGCVSGRSGWAQRLTNEGYGMSNQMDIKRVTEFGEAWNSGDAELVASYFTEDGSYHASVGPDRLGKSFRGRDEVRRGVQRFFETFPGGRFDNSKVHLFGNFGTFEWDFRSEEHTSELQSLMRISYAVLCL